MNTFDPHGQIQRIAIVGCGGTGSQVARSVARMLYDMQQSRQQTPRLLLIDPDTVEMKNVGRQLFTPADVGQFKAQVLMQRFNLALGLDAVVIPEAVNVEKHLPERGNLVIGCVDNHLARRELAKAEGTVWIDAGNHASSGQVVIGNTSDADLLQRNLTPLHGIYRYLPNAARVFPQLLEPDDTPQPQASCAENVVANTQDLLINDWLAIVVSQYVYKLLHRQPITSHMTYISADSMGVRSVAICRDELLPYLQVEV